MLLLRPLNLAVGRLVLVLVAGAIIVGSLPSRKGIAIGFNYFIEQRSRHTGTDGGSPTTG
jgi:hypothetical protein